MKTRYILHGGYASKENEENNRFFKDILSIDKNELNILLVLFASLEERVGEKKKEVMRQFNINNEDKALNFEVANEKDFIKQVKEANIVYLEGGKTWKLLQVLKKYNNFPKLFKGKTVAGESAGAQALSTCFCSKKVKRASEGLGLVPVKVICHYIGKNREKLDDCPNNLEELLLKDFEYKAFEL